jgi:hypothetical protein
MKRFKNMLTGKVGLAVVGTLDLETTANQGNPFPDKEKVGKNQGQGCV